jgi:inward rectifier potassium channel
LLGFAVATGLLYGRFSKPNAKIAYSRNAIIAPYRKSTALMFRIANGRKTQLVECEVTVTIGKIENEDGREVRRFYPLMLERNRITLFPTSWTVVHPIDSESPLYQKTLQDMESEDIEIVVYFKGYDEVFANEVHYRISYKSGDLVWGAKFRINFEQLPSGTTVHYLDRIHDFDRISLPAEILAES